MHQCAVTGNAGTATLHLYDERWSHSLVLREDRRLQAKIEVDTIALTTVIERAAALADGQARVIAKIDAEGSEYDVILNSPASALARIDELFLEIHAYAPGSPDTLLRRLCESGFAGTPATLPSGSHHLIHCYRLTCKRPRPR